MKNKFKVKDLIEYLKYYNPEAEVIGIIDYISYPLLFIGFGEGDGCTKENCDNVSLHFTTDNGETI